MLATRLYEMCHRIEGTHIVIDHYPTGIDTRTDAVVEHQRNTGIHQTLEMIVFLGVLRLRDNNTAYLVLEKRLTNSHLSLIVLTTLCHHDTIATGRGFLLNTSQHGGEIKMSEFRDDDTYYFYGLHLRMA